MRLLLLALPVLAFLPQVIPAYGGEKKCLYGSGICRKSCKDGEVFQDRCKNRLNCCVPAYRSHKQKASGTWTTEASSTVEYDLNSYFINELSTVTNT
ncbi:defensin beta 118 [Phodopus roborovskii]|nr:defensin beta 118 [Phodopus roborovskii]